MTISTAQRLKAALDRRERAEENVSRVLKREYPVGATLSWGMGSGGQIGTVVQHGYGDRIRVRNRISGKEYWIDAWRIARTAGRKALENGDG